MITLQTIQNAKLLEKYYFDLPTYTYQSLVVVGGGFTFGGWQSGVTQVSDLKAHHSGKPSDNPFITTPNGAWRSKLPSRNNWAFDVTLTRSSDNDWYYMSTVQHERNDDGTLKKVDGKLVFEKWVRTTTKQSTVPILAPFDGYISALNQEANAYITLTPNNGGKTFVFMHGEWLAEAGQNSLPPGFNFYQVGKTFSKGEKIGLQGNRSEHAMAHHLHFEVNIDEKEVLETYVNNLLNGF